MSGIVYSVAAGVGILSAGQIVLNVVILFFMVRFVITVLFMFESVQ